MVQSIANTALRLSQDLAFRPSGAEEKEKVIDSLLADARQLAPQDPDLLSVQIYSQFMRKARDPKVKDLMLMDAYLNYVNRLRHIENRRSFLSKAFEIENEQIITPGRFLQKLYYVGAAAFLNHLDIATVTEPLASLLLAKSDEYIRTGIKVSQEEKDDIYESVLWALKVEYGLKALDRGINCQSDIEDSLSRAQNFFARFRNNKKKETQLTGYDGSANIYYLKGKYLSKTGNKREAIQQLKEALKQYAQVASLFPGKVNTVEVEKAKALLLELSRTN